MNANNIIQTAWQQLPENQRGVILDVLYEHGISHMRIKDYSNAVLTCSQWSKALTSKYYQSTLKDIYLVSTSLFQRFVSKAREIDRTDNPKSIRIPVPMINMGIGLWTAAGAFGGQLAFDYETVPQSQKEYEIHALEGARSHTDSNDNYKTSFQDMSDQDRNNLLDVVNEINLTRLITSEEFNKLPIGCLIKLHSHIKKEYPQLEVILLRTNILGFERKSDSIGQLGLFILLILLLKFVLICYCYWQVKS